MMAKNLGVTLNDKLLFSANMATALQQQEDYPILAREVAQVLTQVFIISHLDYRNSLLTICHQTSAANPEFCCPLVCFSVNYTGSLLLPHQVQNSGAGLQVSEGQIIALLFIWTFSCHSGEPMVTHLGHTLHCSGSTVVD